MSIEVIGRRAMRKIERDLGRENIRFSSKPVLTRG